MAEFNRELSVVEPLDRNNEYAVYEAMDLAYYAEMHETFRFQLPRFWFQTFEN